MSLSFACKPIRLAFCITDLDAGGAERALVQLVTRLNRQRWNPSVYCLTGPGELVANLKQADVPVTCLAARSYGDLSVVFRLARLLRRQRPTLLQTYLYHANIVGRVSGRLARVPHILSGIRVAEKRSRFRLWLDRMTERCVERHVCVSQSVADFSIRRGGLPAEKVVVIPNGVDSEIFRNAVPADLSEFGIQKRSRTLLFVGRLDPQKGPRMLLDAATLLFAGHDDVQILLVGDGPLRAELETAVRQRGQQARIHFAGRRQDVPALMKSADCLVLPSRWEGMPNVVLEAMAAGLPVVATDVDGIGELIESGETGLLVPSQKPQALAEAIQTVLNDSERTTEMVHAAQHIIQKHFMWNSSVEKYDRLYTDLIET